MSYFKLQFKLFNVKYLIVRLQYYNVRESKILQIYTNTFWTIYFIPVCPGLDILVLNVILVLGVETKCTWTVYMFQSIYNKKFSAKCILSKMYFRQNVFSAKCILRNKYLTITECRQFQNCLIFNIHETI